MIHLACQYFLNHHLKEDELRKQVRELAAGGYECIYAHARQGLMTPYLSKGWWDAVSVILEECRNAGIKFAIWDEDCYPSPVAGNRILWEHPELGAQHLEFTQFDARKGEHVRKVFETPASIYRCFAVCGENILDITEYCGTLKTECIQRALRHCAYSLENKINMPHWRAVWDARRFALDWQAEDDCKIVAVQVCRFPSGGHNTDLMKPEMTRLFLETTHGEYLRRYGQETFDELFDASFMDEPSVDGVFPWTDAFEQEFAAQHGFELTPYLPHLAVDINEQSPFIRHCYRMTQHRLVCTHYLEQTQEWCRSHHIRSIGHLSRTEYLSVCNSFMWPDELRSCKYLDTPCTDPLGAGAAWPDACAYHTGLKVVSSAAHLFGKEQAGSDALAVLGNEVSLRDLRFHLDYQMALGITYFNIHGLSYSFDGARKDEVPPSLFYQHTEWRWMPELLNRTRELCKILSSGTHLCKTAVLYTSASFYCHANPGGNGRLESSIQRFVENLLSHQKDFDFIDEITLRELFDGNPQEFVRKYPCFLLPDTEFMEKATAECLERYAAAGGKLMLAGTVPKLLGSSPENALSHWDNAETYRCANYPDELSGPVLTGNGKQDILIQQREIDGKKISFLFNRAERPFSGALDGAPVWLPPSGGTLFTGEPSADPLSNTESVTEVRDWEIEFHENHVPLNCWSCRTANGARSEFRLLEREIPDFSQLQETTVESTFLYTGEKRPVRLVLEESTFRGNRRCFVNGTEIHGFQPSQEYDCRNRSADITHALLAGSTPTLNRIQFILSGDGCAMSEMPYLYGRFKAEFRHAGKTLPYLESFDGKIQCSPLYPWSACGYGTYSGSAEYRAVLNIPDDGSYLLDLGRVEDLAEVFLDEVSVAVLIGPPYVAETGFLKQGAHELRITVCNGPGNRDRLADLASGLLGPVTLRRKR